MAQSTSTEEVVVTGSRVTRDGYNAPTPVTVLSSEMLDQMANTNIADSLNSLPQFTTSVTQTSQVGGFSGGTLGVNNLNLRGLGAQRTLVLQDGKRIVNASINTQFSAPDINTIPDALVSRVDVVTGGASAAYGSDALTGVVNFVLDHDYTGVKGKVEGGLTSYGDNWQYTTSLTAGTAFGPGDRGHILLSGEIVHNDGVHGNYRPWEAAGGSVVQNPNWTTTNGLPYLLTLNNVGVGNRSPGGLIVSGPLRGINFGAGGQPANFNFGLVSRDGSTMQGGDWQSTREDQIGDLVSANNRTLFFGHTSYDISDNFQVYAELQWVSSRDQDRSLPNNTSATVQTGNPLIPAAVQAKMTAAAQSSFVVGTELADVGQAITNNLRVLSRWAVGATGKFDLFGSNWGWDGYVQGSANAMSINVGNDVNTANLALAADAVTGPNGTVICRSSIANPTNGCVPFDVMGTGVNSRAAINYVTGIARLHQTLREDVQALNMHGEPFSLWAGPISLAFGIEHRREAIGGVADAADEANLYTLGNYHQTPAIGAPAASYNVTEGYVETVIPLAKDASWAKTLDVNGAIRATGYSTSGEVTTWKVGGNWQPIDDIRFRYVRSRDIRAPNLGELFSGGQSSNGLSYFDFGTTPPHATPSSVITQSTGNINLKPEVANSTGAGIVLTPTFLPGFQASVDYYNIDISGAVTVPSAQTAIDLCYVSHNPGACALISRGANGEITRILTSPANINSQSAEGVDLDATYRFSLVDVYESWKGDITIRGVGTYVSSMNRVSFAGDATGAVTTTSTQGAGVVGYYADGGGGFSNYAPMAPKWRHDLFITYANDPFSATLIWHYIAPGVYNKALTSCTSGCPGNQLTIDNNYIGSNTTFDVNFTYKPFPANNTDMFLTVSDITNQAPPFIGGNTGFTYAVGQYNYNYDRIGRTYKAGVRFEL